MTDQTLNQQASRATTVLVSLFLGMLAPMLIHDVAITGWVASLPMQWQIIVYLIIAVVVFVMAASAVITVINSYYALRERHAHSQREFWAQKRQIKAEQAEAYNLDELISEVLHKQQTLDQIRALIKEKHDELSGLYLAQREAQGIVESSSDQSVEPTSDPSADNEAATGSDGRAVDASGEPIVKVKPVDDVVAEEVAGVDQTAEQDDENESSETVSPDEGTSVSEGERDNTSDPEQDSESGAEQEGEQLQQNDQQGSQQNGFRLNVDL